MTEGDDSLSDVQREIAAGFARMVWEWEADGTELYGEFATRLVRFAFDRIERHSEASGTPNRLTPPPQP